MTDPTQRAPDVRARGAKNSAGRLNIDESSAAPPSLFDAAAEEGKRRSLHGEDVRIVAAIETEIRRLAALRIEFLPDDVMPDLMSRRAVGAVFSKLERAGVIRCVGARNSTRPSRHGALTRVWIGGEV